MSENHPFLNVIIVLVFAIVCLLAGYFVGTRESTGGESDTVGELERTVEELQRKNDVLSSGFNDIAGLLAESLSGATGTAVGMGGSLEAESDLIEESIDLLEQIRKEVEALEDSSTSSCLCRDSCRCDSNCCSD